METLIDIREYLKRYPDSEYENVEESFITFMVDNEWFQTHPRVSVVAGKRTLLFSEEEILSFEDQLSFYMKGKDLDTEHKAALLFKCLNSRFPETARSLDEYLHDEKNDNIKISLYNFLAKYQKKEIYTYSNKEMDKLIALLCDEITLSAGMRFTDYLNVIRRKRQTVFTTDFIMESRNPNSKTKQAYDSETFLKLAYYLFNQNYIEEQDMIVRACESWQTANTWLYLAIHMICALRDTDIVNLPAPRLTKMPIDIIESIKAGSFTDVEARACTLSVTRQLSFFGHRPSKTQNASNVPDIKLYFPESAQVLFGTLLALVEAHRRLLSKEDMPLIKPVRDYERICSYLGDDIGYLFLEDNFSVRSANKAYMQAVELFADDILDSNGNLTHAKGYMLAALARSHKGSYGEFAHTSEIYLKDANFSGYSAQFIAKELFERGVCAFIPAMLLAMVTDGEYEKLPVHHQTKMIQTMGLSAANIEALVGVVGTSMKQAAETVKALVQAVQEPYGAQRSILSILQNIASGGAVSKQDDSMCLLTAMGQSCKCPDTQQCIGCKYEISTKSTIYLLMNEYNRMQQLKEKAGSPQLQQKYIRILKEIIVPKISEVLTCMQENYGDESVREIESIIQEMQHGN